MRSGRSSQHQPGRQRRWRPGILAGVVALLHLAASPEARAQESMDGLGVVSPAARFAAPAVPPPPPPPTDSAFAIRTPRRGFWEVAKDSLTGPADDGTWRPLSLRTFFTEGWDEAWAAEPDQSGDAQQGWINAADGNFYRLWFFSYTYTNRIGRPDGHTGAYTVYLPLNRRLELVASIPFVTSQPTFNLGKSNFPNPNPPRPDQRSTGFGDLTLTPRFMMIEQDNFTLVTQVSVQTPTGTRRAGAGQSILTPGVQFWWNFAESWVMRGGFSTGVGTNRQANGTTLASQLAIGKVFTPADVPIFGDFTLYLSANVFNTVSAGSTFASLTPGYRTHLGGGWYSLGGIEIPVTGPRPFEESAVFWIMKTF